MEACGRVIVDDVAVTTWRAADAGECVQPLIGDEVHLMSWSWNEQV